MFINTWPLPTNINKPSNEASTVTKYKILTCAKFFHPWRVWFPFDSLFWLARPNALQISSDSFGCRGTSLLTLWSPSVLCCSLVFKTHQKSNYFTFQTQLTKAYLLWGMVALSRVETVGGGFCFLLPSDIFFVSLNIAALCASLLKKPVIFFLL